MTIWNHTFGPGTRAVFTALVLFGLLLLGACSSKAMNLVFDMPPPDPEDVQDVAAQVESPSQPASSQAYVYWGDSEEDRPPVEAVKDWEQAVEMLPTDKKGRVDWSTAVRDGTVRPRALNPEDMAARAFQMDFVIPAEKERFDAWFPHSSHTEWLGCKNCHGTIFKYANNEMTMKQMRAGESCGACHNNGTAFTLKDCGRCHLAMKK